MLPLIEPLQMTLLQDCNIVKLCLFGCFTFEAIHLAELFIIKKEGRLKSVKMLSFFSQHADIKLEAQTERCDSLKGCRKRCKNLGASWCERG